MRSCTICGKDFSPFNSMQTVCGVRCAKRVPIKARKEARADRVATKTRLAALQPISHWRRQAQQAFNAYIRARDSHLPCISCGRMHQGSWDAGHFLTVGARPELRFDEANCHRQCVPCNQHLHGNLILYRIGLIARVGQAEVDRLEGPQAPRHLSADDLKAIRDHYRAKLRTLQKERA